VRRLVELIIVFHAAQDYCTKKEVIFEVTTLEA